MLYYGISMNLENGQSHEFSETEITTMFGGKNFDEWQSQLIRLAVENKTSILVETYRGVEIFTCTYSPTCKEKVCFMYNSMNLVREFAKYIDNNN